MINIQVLIFDLAKYKNKNLTYDNNTNLKGSFVNNNTNLQG